MFEVACGNCQGRLLVQQAGVVVACPHCGSHLTIGGPPAAPTPPAPAPAPAFAPPPQPQFSAPPPQPQYAPAPQPAPQQFAPPQPQFAPAPQYAPQPVPQPYQQPQPPVPQPPVPQPQFAPPPQPIAAPPQPAAAPYVPQPVYQPMAEAPIPQAPPPAPVPFVSEPVAEQPAASSFFAPAEAQAEPASFDFGGNEDAVEPSWMTPAEPAPQATAPEAPAQFAPAPEPTFAEPAPFAPEPAPAYAPQPFAVAEAPAPAPQFAPEQPAWAAAAAIEAPAAPSYEQQFAPAPAAPAPMAPAAAPAWAQPEAPAAYAPAPQMAPQAAPAYQPAPAPQYGSPAPQYAEQPAAYADPQAQQWYGAQTTAAPADNMAAAFGTAAATAAAAQASPYGAAPSAYPAQPTAPAAQPTVAPAKAPATVSRGLFIMLANYASVMTLIAGYLFFNGSAGGGNSESGTNATERIPDVEPIKDKKTGKLIYQVVKPDSLLAEHQTLELGQTKRFGNLEVTPSKVVVGEIAFTTLQGGSAELMAPPAKVMQLHLSFKNVSKDQSIAPLRSLAFRQSKGERGYVSNIFVCPFNKRGRTILAYPLDEQSLRVKGLDLERELKPGESCDLFIPTAFKGVDDMLEKNKDFVWRVQFRKGYDSKNFGVTTLIEVKFDKSKVEMKG